MKKPSEDTNFWRVDRVLGDLLVKMATGHAEAGGEAVVLTNRKLTPEQEGKISFSGAKVVSTRGER